MAELWMDVDAALTGVPVNLVPLIDDTDFKTPETAVAHNAAGLTLFWNFVTTGGVYTQTAVTPTTGGGDYDWTHLGGGMYAIGMPATEGASANNDAEGFGWYSGVATGVLPFRGPVIGFRANALNSSLVDGATINVNVTKVNGATVGGPGVVDANVVSAADGALDGKGDWIATGPNVRYVATSADGGSDSNDGTTWSAPFLTIAAAVASLTGGGTIHVGGGTFTVATKITTSKAFTIAGRGKHKTRLEGASGVKMIEALAGIKLKDLSVTSLDARAIDYQPASANTGDYAQGLEVEDCFIRRKHAGSTIVHGSDGSAPVYIQTTFAGLGRSAVRFARCEIDAVAAAVFAEDGHDVVFEDCDVISTFGVHVGGSTPNVVYRGCRFHNTVRATIADGTVPTCINISAARSTLIDRCILVVEDTGGATMQGVFTQGGSLDRPPRVQICGSVIYTTRSNANCKAIVADGGLDLVLVDRATALDVTRCTEVVANRILYSDDLTPLLTRPTTSAGTNLTTTVIGRVDAATSSAVSAAGTAATAAAAAADAAAAVSAKIGAPATTLADAIAAKPTAAENAVALLDRADGIETGWTLKQILRLLSSVLLGKTSDGGKTFRDINDTKNRVTATVDSTNNRTSITRDAS